MLRFGWAFSLSLTETGYIHADLMLTILAPLEVFRYVYPCDRFRSFFNILYLYRADDSFGTSSDLRTNT